MQSNDQSTLATAPTARWVWYCTEESIEAGQISVLAIVEIFAATALYWWLASRFDWPWMAIISIIATPMLLLRSEKSVALGVKLLRSYWEGHEERFGKKEIGLIGLASTLTTILTLYWLANHWLPGHSGWPLFWRAAVLIAFTVAIAVAVVSAFAVAFAVSFAGAMAFSVKYTGTGAVIVAFAGAVALSFAVAGSGADTITLLVIAISILLFIPFLPLGILLRGFAIRLFATLQYPVAGLAQLPQNWRQTFLTIDFLQTPELLPQAGTIDSDLTAIGLWRTRQKYFNVEKIFVGILLLVLYIPAIAYRWNLKASAWLWFPLVLSITPPAPRQNPKTAHNLPAMPGWGWHYLALAAFMVAWLFFPLPADWLPLRTLLPSELAPPSAPGLRIAFAWGALTFTLLLAYHTIQLKTAYSKIPQSPDHSFPHDGNAKENLMRIAKKIEYLRIFLTSTLIMWGYAMATGLLHRQYPAEVTRFIWPWLLAIL